MPIAVEAGIACVPVYDPSEPAGGREAEEEEEEEEEEEASSCSSIGENSDASEAVGSGSDGEEVQGKFKGALGTLDALEESLPIRLGISRFYSGKSKSFTSLADVSSSAKDLAKPENTYTRKRKNFLAYKIMLEKPHDNLLRSVPGDGISKRPANSNRAILPFGAAKNNSESDCSKVTQFPDQARLLPPLHRPAKPATGSSALSSTPLNKCLFSMRSFSMADLQGASDSSTPDRA